MRLLQKQDQLVRDKSREKELAGVFCRRGKYSDVPSALLLRRKYWACVNDDQVGSYGMNKRLDGN